jgi:hypothetical protein
MCNENLNVIVIVIIIMIMKSNIGNDIIVTVAANEIAMSKQCV